MGAAPRVSVVITFLDPPVSFLSEAINSVISQTTDSWELVLVDDGSRNESTAFAKATAEAHPARVAYLDHTHHANLGISASRNLAIAQSKAPLIALLDADDAWLPNKLEEQIRVLDLHPDAGLLYGSTLYWHSWSDRRTGKKRDRVPKVGVAVETLHHPPHLLARFLSGRAAVPCTCSVLFRRDVATAVGNFDARFTGLYEDQAFYAKMCLHAPVFVSGEVWDRYRQHEHSICATTDLPATDKKRAEYLDWLANYLRHIGNQDVNLWNVLRREQRLIRRTVLSRVSPKLERARRRAERMLPASLFRR